MSQWCRWDGNAWANPNGKGHSHWEELPYWLRGFPALAYLTGDERLVKEARRWMDALLASQDRSGSFVPKENGRRRDLWPPLLASEILRTPSEATGIKRVLPFLLRFCRWLMTIPFEDFLPSRWQKWRGGDWLDSVLWLSNRTGESWRRDLARLVPERTADGTGGILTWRGVHLCQGFRQLTQFGQVRKDLRSLPATIRNDETVMGISGQGQGGMFAADEHCRPGSTGPQQAAETCRMAAFLKSHAMLAGITGDGIWADRAEEIAFPSFPAAFPPDDQALPDLTAPNMVPLSRGNKAPSLPNAGTMLSYEPSETYRCCQHHHGLGWTSFAEPLWRATPRNSTAALFSAPCEGTAKVGDGTTVPFLVDTDDPFDDTVRLPLRLPQPTRFPLALHIPSWCEGATVTLNGRQLKGDLEPNSFALTERQWRDGDVINLKLPMRLQVKVWEKQRNAISVRYGPLWFSLKIGERWEKDRQQGDWAAWEVFPTTAFNDGLIVDLKNPQRSFEVIRKPKPLPSPPVPPDAAPIE